MNIYNKLRKFEINLLTAYKADFIRALTNKDLEELISIGEELDIIYKNNHCPKCTLNFIKKLAVPYFEQKQKLEEKKCLKDKELIEEGEKTSPSQNK